MRLRILTTLLPVAFTLVAASVHAAAPARGAAGDLSDRDRQAIDSIDWIQVREEGAALLSKYLQIQSLSGTEGETAAAAFLAEEAKNRTLAVERLDSAEGNPNVLALTNTARPPSILFMTHLDVVAASEDGWKHPPFSGTRADGAVWGRGAADTKGLTVMHLLAMTLLKRIDPEYPHSVGLLCVNREEVGGYGAKWILENARAKLGRPVVFGEGGAGVQGIAPVPAHVKLFTIAAAEKSTLWLKLTLALNNGGHGASPPPEYASRQMVLALNRLISAKIPIRITPETETFLKNLAPHLGFPSNLFLRRPNWPVIRSIVERATGSSRFLTSVMHDTITLTRIETDSPATNVIPLNVSAFLDCRLLPGTRAEDFIARIRSNLGDERIQVEIQDQSPQALGSRSDVVYRALEASILELNPGAVVTPYLSPTSSDGNLFRAVGMPTFGVLPAMMTQEELDGIHGTNERLQESSIEQGTRAFLAMLLRIRNWSNP